MVLSFLVDKQIITRVDKEKVVRDSMNYLYANFEFSPDWTGQKTAVFKSKSGAFNVLLDDDGKCLVPWEVLQDEVIEISVFCGALITANVVKIITLASGYTIGEEGREPTPDVYTQIMEKLSEIEAEVDPESLQALIDAYLADKDFVTEDDVETIVAAYVDAHKSEWQGSEVEVTQTLSSGTKIAEISVDGTTTNLYAPAGGGGATALDDLTDVSLTTPQSGDVLVYDGEKWVNGKSNPYYGKNVVHMGDSIVQLYNVAELSAEKAGYNVTNCGFQGTTICDSSNMTGYNSKYFSLIRLAKAIKNDDWTEQEANLNVSQWGVPYNKLRNVDWSSVDVLILSYGTNDWSIQSQLGDAYARDDYSICGALKTAIGIFNTINPEMEIIVTTPIHRHLYGNEGQLTQVYWGNNTFVGYRNAICFAAAECGVKVIDLWALSGINDYNFPLTITDGLHPTELGQTMWSDAFVGALESGYCGVANLEQTPRITIPNENVNLIQDCELFMTHLKYNATYYLGDYKYLCTARDAANSECVFAIIKYDSLPVGTKIRIQAQCRSSNSQAHSIGFRLHDPNTDLDVLNESTEVQSYAWKGVEITTSEAYTNKFLVFYMKNATAFSESVALARNITCTVTLPS